MPIKTYRKKPVTIEAVEYTGLNSAEIESFTGQQVGKETGKPIMIKTLEGQHIASLGDFIIKGVKGEFYPCKPDIFAETYSEV
jgi:hypothetical protein